MIFAKDTQTLEQIATDAAEYYRKRMQRNRPGMTNVDPCSHIVSYLEVNGILLNISNRRPPFSRFDPIILSLELPISMFFLESNSMRLMTSSTLLMNSLPFGQQFNKFFDHIGVPQNYINSSILGLYSAGFVYLQQRKINNPEPLSPLTFVTRSISIFGLFTFGDFLTSKLHQLLPFLPEWVLTAVTSRVISDAAEYISRIGIYETISYLVENVFAFFSYLMSPTLPQLPIEVDVPNSLACPICHELLTDPKELLGFFFCANCLDNWLSNHSKHPYTGEDVQIGMSQHSMIMNQIARKWQKLTLERLKEEEQQQQQNQ
ncbi:hypothetical protein GPJ56_007637 [Histomonas meleagridis]|uniref:uncharacterized protein n=1 Tax=Histomonas meleagridis TaxID=135588 RepID=UPI003559E79B|nr:hypothetical protein GPJ56_007637 [Histomonas meleagridis]KAH0799448.1 hypothetical protein GO595_007849 [Histomonas meleagridis]